MIRTTIPETKTMPPKLDEESATERVQIVAPASWIARIEEWRSKQRPIPSRSEAIRILVDRTLLPEKPRG